MGRTVSGVKLPDGLAMASSPGHTHPNDEGGELGHVRSVEGHGKARYKKTSGGTGEATLKLFTAYQSHAKSWLHIPDFKLEFGRLDGGLIQIDEPPTHDSARFWAEKFYEPGKPQEAHCLDKEFLRATSRG
jgi:phosphoribosylaminoimidazole-succinocarboxamide synthase